MHISFYVFTPANCRAFHFRPISRMPVSKRNCPCSYRHPLPLALQSRRKALALLAPPAAGTHINSSAASDTSTFLNASAPRMISLTFKTTFYLQSPIFRLLLTLMINTLTKSYMQTTPQVGPQRSREESTLPARAHQRLALVITGRSPPWL